MTEDDGADGLEDWWIYTGSGEPHDKIRDLPPAPGWRPSRPSSELEDLPAVASLPRPEESERGAKYLAPRSLVRAVNAALYLRRPLLVTGDPGIGKSTLAYAIAHELQLGPVLSWPINSRSVLPFTSSIATYGVPVGYGWAAPGLTSPMW